MTTPQILTVTKSEAARAQLETAIQLFFRDGNPIAIHTLATAAHQLLHDINKQSGGASSLRDPLFVKPGCKAEWHQLITEEQNFFKHANRDPNGTLRFLPHRAACFMLDACQLYRHLTEERPRLMKLFTTWMVLRNPEMFVPSPEDGHLYQSIREHYGCSEKMRFYDKLYEQREE